VNAAYLLYRCRTEAPPARNERTEPPPAGAGTEQLRALVCGLDPASSFAEKVFLDTAPPGQKGEDR